MPEQREARYEKRLMLAREAVIRRLTGTQDWPEPERGGRCAAVLVLLRDEKEGLQVVLTRRADRLRRHAGEVSLPGGRIDCGDATPEAAALREAEEELGVSRERIAPIGRLPQCTTSHGDVIYPVIGLVAGTVVWRPNPAEVAEVVEIPLDFFLDPASYQRRWIRYLGEEREVLHLRYRSHPIWGLTARILRQVCDRVVGLR
jgi:8-oxo-dGTP pyrophosphatase MutT (NUDIX family)